MDQQRLVVGSGVAVELQDDGSIDFSINLIGRYRDKKGNVTALCSPAQAMRLVRWLVRAVECPQCGVGLEAEMEHHIDCSLAAD